MKRVLAGVLLAALALTALYGYSAGRRDRAYRTQLEAGETALAQGDTAAAIEAFSVAISLKRESMIGYLKRGEAYRTRHEPDAALRDLRRASEIDPLAPRPYELLGDVNYTLERFDRAAAKYRRCIDLDDRSARVLYKLGLALYAGGQPAAALAPLRKAIELDERFGEAHYAAGLCLRDLQRPREAVASLQRAVARGPALLAAREALGDLYGRLGRHDDRIAQLEALRALDASAAREVALGLAYAGDGRTDYAVSTLGRALERYPDYRYTHVALGRTWLDIAEARGDRAALGKALEALEAAVGTDAGSEAHVLLGRALLLAGQHARAAQVLEAATEKRPVDPLAFQHLADLAERAGQLDRAREALLDYHALEGAGMDPRRHAALAGRIADYSLRLGDASHAVTWYARTVDMGGAEAALLVRYADAQARTGDLPAARVTLGKALEKDPDSAAARVLYRRLYR